MNDRFPLARPLRWALLGLVLAACGTSLPFIGDDAGESPGLDAATTTEPPANDGAGRDSSWPLDADAGVEPDADADAAAGDSGACVLIRNGNVISGCSLSSVGLTASLAKVRDGGTICPPRDPVCCELSSHASDASLPVSLSFDLDTGVLIWNGIVFQPLTKQTPRVDGGPVTYDRLPPANTRETLEVGRSLLLAGDASMVGADGLISPWLAVRPGEGGIAGEVISSTGFWTPVTFDANNGTLAVKSSRYPQIITGNGCNPTGLLKLEIEAGVLQDAGRD